MSSILPVVVCLSMVLVAVHSCYIQSCPFGPANFQKRSAAGQKIGDCGKCGPSDEGDCYGEHVCCVAGKGCMIGKEWTQNCARQQKSLIPCKPPGSSCSMAAPFDGFCALNGICCNDDSCGVSEECAA